MNFCILAESLKGNLQINERNVNPEISLNIIIFVNLLRTKTVSRFIVEAS